MMWNDFILNDKKNRTHQLRIWNGKLKPSDHLKWFVERKKKKELWGQDIHSNWCDFCQPSFDEHTRQAQTYNKEKPAEQILHNYLDDAVN